MRLVRIFGALGLTEKHAKVFGELLASRKSTPLSLAKATGLNRSSIYRYLEELKDAGLIEENIEANSTSYSSAQADKLEIVIAKQEEKLAVLKEVVPELISKLKEKGVKKAAQTQIKYYQGKEGLKQMLWNIVKMRPATEFLGYGYLSWNESVGRKYAESLREIIKERKIQDREINNTVGTLLGGKPWTEVADYDQFHEERVLTPEVLEIRHDTYIYNDVFAFYYFYQGELFGVEIHNAEIAKTQRQIFEILWSMAKKVKR